MRNKFQRNLIKTYTFSLKKINLKMSSAKWQASCSHISVWTLFIAIDFWGGLILCGRQHVLDHGQEVGTCRWGNYDLQINYFCNRIKWDKWTQYSVVIFLSKWRMDILSYRDKLLGVCNKWNSMSKYIFTNSANFFKSEYLRKCTTINHKCTLFIYFT